MTVKNRENAEKSQVVLTIEVGAEEFNAAMEKAYRKMRKQLRVPGFRPGKAPRAIIEKMYGPEVFFEDAVTFAFPDAYQAAVKEQDLRVVGQASVELDGQVTKDGFTFKATAPVYPEVTLGQYKGLSAPRREASVTEEDVDAHIKELRERNTRLVSVERPAREGDVVTLDFEGFLDGKAFDGGKGINHSLELGSHSFIPGFEEQVAGMSAGEERDITVTFPEDYVEDLRGKEAVFHVSVHEIKEKDEPELDDEFAKDVSEFDTLAELRDDLRREIEKEQQESYQRQFEDELLEQVADKITAEIPDVMVENQADQMLDNLKSRIYSQGMSYETYQQMTGSSEESLRTAVMEPALRQVRMDLAIAAIIDAEKLEAMAEDVDAEYGKLAENSGLDIETVKKYFTEEQVKDQVLTRKAIAVVADSATVTDWTASEDSQEETEDGGEG